MAPVSGAISFREGRCRAGNQRIARYVPSRTLLRMSCATFLVRLGWRQPRPTCRRARLRRRQQLRRLS